MAGDQSNGVRLRGTRPRTMAGQVHCQRGGLIPRVTLGAWLASALVLWSCAARIQPETITQFGTGVNEARAQAQAAFRAANNLARDVSIEYALTQSGLSDASFVTAVKPEDANAWDEAFGKVSDYVGLLRTLLSPDRAQGFEASAVAFSTELTNLTGGGASLPAGVATSFTKLGGLLLKAKAERAALRIMAMTDPGIRDVFTAMADALGATQGEGLRGTVFSNWLTAMTGPQGDFLQPAKKRAAVMQYLDMMDRRDAQDDALASLGRSLMLLADAHTSASKGSKADTAQLVEMVSHELEGTKKLYEEFKKAKEAGQP